MVIIHTMSSVITNESHTPFILNIMLKIKTISILPTKNKNASEHSF